LQDAFDFEGVGPPANSPFLLRFLIAMRVMALAFTQSASWAAKALTLAAFSSSSGQFFG
jgi:hypothetical protein